MLVLLGSLGGGAALISRGVSLHGATVSTPRDVRTEGTVVAVQKHCFKGCTYQPTIEYMVAGRSYLFKGGMHNTDPAIGSSNPIAYDPAHPGTAYDLAGNTAWAVDIIFGGLLVLVGALILFRLIRARRRAHRRRGADPSAL